MSEHRPILLTATSLELMMDDDDGDCDDDEFPILGTMKPIKVTCSPILEVHRDPWSEFLSAFNPYLDLSRDSAMMVLRAGVYYFVDNHSMTENLFKHGKL